MNYIQKYFRRKRRHWFAVCKMNAIDPSLMAFSKMTVVSCFRSFREVKAYVDKIVSHDYIIVKTTVWVIPGDKIGTNASDEAIRTSSQAWTDIGHLTSRSQGHVKADDKTIAAYKKFIDNEEV